MNTPDLRFAWDFPLAEIQTPYGSQLNHDGLAEKLIEKAHRYRPHETMHIHNQIMNLSDSLKMIHNTFWKKRYTDEDRKTARRVFNKEIKVLNYDLIKVFEKTADKETEKDIKALLTIAIRYLK
ncbi:MAG: hypothetical protein K0S53_671 [Bacteroidetes bacterium]|jgi:hypothetical protein|nr:hypothetical protein [Bacteroidota bacterium]